jgi:hypothetical protein
MAIHEHLPRIPKADLNLMGWIKARELVKVARRESQNFDCAPWVRKARELPREEFKKEVEKHLTGAGNRALGDHLLQAVQEPTAGIGAGARDGCIDARQR